MYSYKKLSYKKDKKNGDIIPPEIFLCNRTLDVIGKLYPVESPNIITNYNAANEISFSYPKEVNGRPSPLYDKIQDLSIIKVEHSYYEISVSQTDQGNLTKNVSGKSLGYCELSQKLVTLEINTDSDIARADYREPTIFYDADKPERSLLHRLLSHAPDYSIGTVDSTLAILQRSFSWSDTFMDSCLNDISEELNCIFTIDVKKDPDTNEPIRQINAYDACYCKDCWEKLTNSSNTSSITGDFWKNVLDGVCLECKSTNIYEFGEDTAITINTRNLTDEIQVTTDKDSVKNCFKLKAGDDLMTNIVQGINITGSERIMMFSDEQQREMSSTLRNKWNDYVKKINDAQINSNYRHLLELNFNILDLILYLESGKLPQLETEKGTLQDQYHDIRDGLSKYNFQFFIDSETESKALTGRNAVKNLLSTFLLDGYSLLVNNTQSVIENEDTDSCYYWCGSYKVYQTDDRENYFTVTVDTNGETVSFHTSDTTNSSENITSTNIYKIVYGNKNQESYKNYLEQQIASLLHDKNIVNKNSQITDWSPYCISRLQSYYDGFSSCIEMLNGKKIPMLSDKNATSNELQNDINNIIEKYTAYMSDIYKIQTLLEDQVFSLYYYLGDIDKLKENYPPKDNTTEYSYTFRHFTKNNTNEASLNAIYSLINGMILSFNTYTENGELVSENSTQKRIGKIKDFDRGVQCSNCLSTNIQYHSDTNTYRCANQLCNASAVVSYSDYAQSIYEWCKNNSSLSIVSEMESIRSDMDLKSFIGEPSYRELCSFVREEVYTNENYISENLKSNSELLSKAYEFTEAAKRNLAKSCVNQVSISADIANLVVQEDLKAQKLSIKNAYEKFALGNYIRAIVDDDVYKLRVISITYPYDTMDKIHVTFSNVTKTLSGSASDLQSILSQSQSMSTSFHTVAEQARKGTVAAKKFDYIKNQGLDASLGAVKAAQNQSITIDDKGFLCTRFNKESGEYDPRQLKIANSNIVMTEDNWDNAKLAIGLGRYGNELKYGIWADLLVGDMIIGKEVLVRNDTSSIVMDGKGISIKKDDTKEDIFSVDTSGNGYFNGTVNATNGNFTGNIIGSTISGGSINIGNGNFTVDHYGTMTATKGTFKGSINASENSNFGSWYVNEYAGLHRKNFDYNNTKYSFTINGNNLEMRDNVGYESEWTDGITGGNYRMRFRINVSQESSDGIYFLGNRVDLYLTDGFFCQGPAHFSTTSCFNNISLNAPNGTNLDSLRILNYTDNTTRTVLGNSNTILYLDSPTIWSSNPITVNSDERLKKEFDELSSYEKFFMSIKPCSYKYINGTSDRKHIGFRAQQIKSSLEQNNMTTQDFAGYVNSSNTEDGELSLRYTEFIALNTHMIQTLYKRIDTLEKILKEKKGIT